MGFAPVRTSFKRYVYTLTLHVMRRDSSSAMRVLSSLSRFVLRRSFRCFWFTERPKTPKTVHRCTSDKGHRTPNNLVAGSIVHTLPRIHLQVIGHEPVPVGASPFLAVTGRSLSLNSAICLIHSSDIFPNKIIGYAIVAAAVNNAAVFIHRNKISLPCFYHSNLKRGSGSCPSVSQYRSLQRVICVFEVRNN